MSKPATTEVVDRKIASRGALPEPFYTADALAAAPVGARLLPPVPLSAVPFAIRRCAACASPNAATETMCSKCGSALRADIEARVCPFCSVVRECATTSAIGMIASEHVRYVDDEVLVLDAKFSIAKFQINVIPRRHIDDLLELDASGLSVDERVALLLTMYRAGVRVLRAMLAEAGHPFDEVAEADEPVSPTFVIGFNTPPSVRHLHLYLIAMPYRFSPEAVESFFFVWPRSKTLAATLASLRSEGRCVVGPDQRTAAGAAEKRAHEHEVARLMEVYAARWAGIASLGDVDHGYW